MAFFCNLIEVTVSYINSQCFDRGMNKVGIRCGPKKAQIYYCHLRLCVSVRTISQVAF